MSKYRKSDLRHANIKRHIDLYSPKKREKPPVVRHSPDSFPLFTPASFEVLASLSSERRPPSLPALAVYDLSE